MGQPYVIAPPSGSGQDDEWVRLGMAAQMAGRLPEAQQHYQKALSLNPRHPLATQNLAIVFAQSNLMNEAVLTIERAAMFDGVHGVIQVNRALMCLESDRLDDALDAARKAFALSPSNHETRMTLAMVLTTAGMPEQAIGHYREILKTAPNHPAAAPNVCFIQTLTDSTPKDLLEQRTNWHEANRFKGKKEAHGNDRNQDRPIRVGYVSGDFKCHSAAMIFSRAVLGMSDQIVPYLYSTLPVNAEADAATKVFQTKVGDRWRDISALDDEKADALIRQDQIDILVDLAAHTNGGRLALFTRKSAPIQVTAWGFAHGTGCPEIDYFLADPVAVPQAERQYYAEKIADIPCIVSFDPNPNYNLKFTSALPYHRNEYLTFGSYARYEKMSDNCLKAYAEILRRVPDSKLSFKDNAYRRPYSIRRIMDLMPDIAPDRLLFSIATSHEEHMRTYQQADLILDPFPHGGGVVALEQLYMGVPMVTRYGTQPSGRSAASVLTTMGKTDWIATDDLDYVEKAVALGENIPLLNKARKTLHAEFMASPVILGYAEAVEQVYRTMWRTWCDK